MIYNAIEILYLFALEGNNFKCTENLATYYTLSSK